jgi:hypothetical protein
MQFVSATILQILPDMLLHYIGSSFHSAKHHGTKTHQTCCRSHKSFSFTRPQLMSGVSVLNLLL